MTEVEKLLKSKNYDIRISNDARFMDQKCTPDVVCIIADCVMNLRESEPQKEFTVQDIWDSQYFIKNVKAIFNKPSATNPTTRSEYDKFIQQPLRLLAYAGVLDIEKKGTTNYYKIANDFFSKSKCFQKICKTFKTATIGQFLTRKRRGLSKKLDKTKK